MIHSSKPLHSADPRSAGAAVLSFLFPGAGQAYNGQGLLAALLAIPAVLVVLLLVVVWAAGDAGFVSRLLDARILVGLIVLDLALLGWRLVAIVQAHAWREALTFRHWTTGITSVLVVVTVAMHALPAYYAMKAVDTLGAISLGGGIDTLDTDETPSRLPTPTDQPEVDRGERVTVLLVGVDFGPGRDHRLTDTMLVASVDPETGRATMVSIPRDLYGVPLPDGTPYRAKLNSLMSAAESDPATYPHGGAGTLKRTIGGLLRTKIHYFAAIDLGGLKRAIDSVGGVTVNVREAVNDPTYNDEFDAINNGFFIQPGTHSMDGATALAYARSRMGEGDNDFTRAERQQQLLTALRDKLTAGNLLLSLPGLLDAVRTSLVTDVPSERLASLAKAVEAADDDIERVVLTPPEYVTPDPQHPAGYVLHPNLETIASLGERLFAEAPRMPQPTGSP
ncbi:MAG: LCP family protein [Chloroflexi bacterium]|nr:LCP family protein [Chloroflexota bacterium]